ncbi:hypothetical protein [Treponema denticola]|uniref:Uncharacterized protein n=1 Tax=Treponema denticola H-22 TaxID=999432 RepID=A0A0E2E4V2_TREDN|nr:hypothetical protein [Treponema denticola]EGC78580.1 hypothetical protein HMPREF9353_00303 [Treponema denticola F0402]EMB33321.1 hypothetical protein HMPREF9726_01682 [Treponema denticola H-22]
MFPNYLDGARVRYYTNEDHFGIVDYNNGEKIIPIHYLAICSYANEQGFYLFFCDEKYNVVSDYFFDSVEECKEVAKKSKENIEWIQKTDSTAEFTFEEIKTLLLKSIDEYDCEAELRIFFENNPNEYMIIIYKDRCSFQRCGNIKKSSGEYYYKTLEELYTATQVDDIILKKDWDKIIAFDCEDFEILGFWK